MQINTENFPQGHPVQLLSIDLTPIEVDNAEQMPRTPLHKVLGYPAYLKRLYLSLLLAVSLLVATMILLSFPMSNALFSRYDGFEVLSPVASYIQGTNEPIVASNPIRLADQQDPARSEAIRLTKDDLQIAQFLSKKYRLAASQVERYIHFAHLAAKEKNLAPTLVLAVMSIESNLNSITESPMGAQGLMQVMTSVHLDKLAAYGGANKVFDPESNIRVGATILADCIKLGGSIEMGLKCYVGASGPTDGGYGAKVLAEKERIEKARLGVFDFTANNKVLIDMGILVGGSVNNNVANDNNYSSNSNNKNPITGSLAAPSPPTSPSGLLPVQPPVTLPAASSANAGPVPNPNVEPATSIAKAKP